MNEREPTHGTRLKGPQAPSPSCPLRATDRAKSLDALCVVLTQPRAGICRAGSLEVVMSAHVQMARDKSASENRVLVGVTRWCRAGPDGELHRGVGVIRRSHVDV